MKIVKLAYDYFNPTNRWFGSVQYTSISELKTVMDKEVDNGDRNGKYLVVSKLKDRWEKYIKNEGQYLWCALKFCFIPINI